MLGRFEQAWDTFEQRFRLPESRSFRCVVDEVGGGMYSQCAALVDAGLAKCGRLSLPR
jgi:hypothetical protein